MANITFQNINLSPHNKIKRKTKIVHKYIIAAKNYNHNYFRLESYENAPDILISSDRIFDKISIMSRSCIDCYNGVYSLFELAAV